MLGPWSTNNKLIATGDKAGYLKLWSLEGKKLFEKKVNSYNIKKIEFTPDGKKILVGGFDLEANLWSIEGDHL